MGNLTREAVLQITGPLDDHSIAEIIGLGAEPIEVIAAKQWLDGNEQLPHPVTAHPRGAIINRIREILAIAGQNWEEP